MNIFILIIILGIILFILIMLNHITIISPTTTTTSSNAANEQGNCSQTAFGCCPDGINSKINFYGTNCPAYNPGPGYSPNVVVVT